MAVTVVDMVTDINPLQYANAPRMSVTLELISTFPLQHALDGFVPLTQPVVNIVGNAVGLAVGTAVGVTMGESVGFPGSGEGRKVVGKAEGAEGRGEE